MVKNLQANHSCLLRDVTVRVAFMWKATVKGDVMSNIDSWQLRKGKKKPFLTLLIRRFLLDYGTFRKERKDNDRTIIILVTNMLSSCTHLHA